MGSDPVAVLPDGSLLSRLGHELRGPLAGIHGLTTAMRITLAAGRSAPERLDRQLELIGSSAAELLRTVEQVVDLVRLDADDPPAATSLDCRAVAAEVIAEHAPAAVARGQRLTLEPGPPVRASGDGDYLRRILTELLGNAAGYADPGEVRIRVRSSPGRPTVEVTDPGPAIPAAEREVIFSPFVRGSTAERREVPGSGLGLCIARRLAERTGARLSLDSTPAGNTFAIHLSPAG